MTLWHGTDRAIHGGVVDYESRNMLNATTLLGLLLLLSF